MAVHLQSLNFLEFLGIPRNSQKFLQVFSLIPKYSQKFQGFSILLICMSGNKLDFLGIPRNSQVSENSFCKGTDCGTVNILRQHCIDKQKLINLITQASKAFLF